MINFNIAKFLGSIGDLKQLKKDKTPHVVFSGKSNVGKSSLINKLLNRKSLARVSNKPGKTININFYDVDKIKFADLPGYGYARVSFGEKKRWAKLIEGYFNENPNIALVIQIIDMRHPPSALDIQMLDFLKNSSYPFIVVASKCDKLGKMARQERENLMSQELNDYQNTEVIPFSSLSGEGIERIKGYISSFCEKFEI